MIRLHIYDMDGTILDSMRMWDGLCVDYMRARGVEPEEGFMELCDPMTFSECTGYMAEHYSLGSREEIYNDIMACVRSKYFEELQLFDDIPAELAAVSESGVPMVILSNTPRPLVLAAMERTGVLGYFCGVYTTEEMGITKDRPEIFVEVCREKGVEPGEALVHEDSAYAVAAALKAGCEVKTYDKYR